MNLPMFVLLLGLLLYAFRNEMKKTTQYFAAGFWVAMFLGVLAVLPGAAAAAGDVIRIPAAHVGDQATYGFEDVQVAIAAAWLPPEKTQDRWGQAVEAHIYQVKIPATVIDDAAWVADFADAREAYAPNGTGPLWRSMPLDRNRATQSSGFELPRLLLAQPGSLLASEEKGVTTVRFDPTPSLASCLGHHGLQGRGVSAGAVVPLATLCPGLARIDAAPSPARPTTFQNHSAMELTYTFGSDVGATRLPPGMVLRVVLAEGLPFLARIGGDASVNDVGAWSIVLTGFDRGEGAEVPRWPPVLADGGPSPAKDVRLAPLGPDGPADGDAGLAYALSDAVANVRSDPNLHEFQAWSAMNPRNFLLAADFALDNDPDSAHARWILTFADPRSDGLTDIITVLTARLLEPDPGEPEFLNLERPLERRQAFVVERPTGQPALDLASAIASSVHHAPTAARELPVSRVFYVTPAPGGVPAYIGVERGDNASGVPRASVVLDARSGAADEVAYYRMSGSVYVPAPPPLPGIEFAAAGAFVLSAIVLAVLAHFGHVAVFYTRLKQSDLLEHDTRRGLYELIRSRPGIHFQGIAAAAGLVNGVAMYHMRVLERGGLVVGVRTSGYCRYYLTGSLRPGSERGAAELQAGRARSVYAAVLAQPGITMGELARIAGVSGAAVTKTVARLERARLIERQVQGRQVRVTAPRKRA